MSSQEGDIENSSIVGETTIVPLEVTMESENTRLLSPNAPRQASPAAAPISESSSKTCNVLSWLNAIALLALIVAVIVIKITGDQQTRDLQAQLVDLQLKFDRINSDVQTNTDAMSSKILKISDDQNKLNENTNNHIDSITKSLVKQNTTVETRFTVVWDKMISHDKALIRLSNGTSNADVLDKLKETKEQVDNQMISTKQDVYYTLETTKHNFTIQLEDTLDTMESVLSDATNHIHEVKKNVTKELNIVQQKLGITVQNLTSSVKSAQNIIQKEVSDVRDHIEQYVTVTNKQFAAENDFVKYQLAGLFTLLSCLIFLWHVTSHMRHYYKPEVQKRITAILWMVPVYSITSWISMMKPSAEPYLGGMRDCYEAYVIYTFVAMLIAIIGDGKSLDDLEIQISQRVYEERTAMERYKQRHQQTNVNDDLENQSENLPTVLKKPKEHFKPPCPCCYNNTIPLSIASTWLWQCKLLAIQFVIMKPLLAIVPFFLHVSGIYDVNKIPMWEDNHVNYHSAKLYILIIQNISVGLAFYGLLSFYHGTEKDLEWCDPWPKFLCIKGIVFATFWQNIAIQIMSAFGLVDEKAANQIQNFLICIEMLIASISHFYVFPYYEWHPTYQKQKERTLVIQDTLALGDFMQDMKSMLTKRNAVTKAIELENQTKSQPNDDNEEYEKLISYQRNFDKITDDNDDILRNSGMKNDESSEEENEMKLLTEQIEMNLKKLETSQENDNNNWEMLEGNARVSTSSSKSLHDKEFISV